MAGEKYIPKVGDKVAIVSRYVLPRSATVTRVLKRYAEVTPSGANYALKFGVSDLRSVVSGRGYSRSAEHIEPWADGHTDAVIRTDAAQRLWSAIDTMRVTGAARERIEALPIARLEGAAEFLRALLAEAKAAKP